jgi:rhodanese-related sulfurtransferase
VALLLKKHGITRVRPLEGGFEAWRDQGFPIEQKLVNISEAEATLQES